MTSAEGNVLLDSGPGRDPPFSNLSENGNPDDRKPERKKKKVL